MFANARQTLAGNQRRPDREGARAAGKPLGHANAMPPTSGVGKAQSSQGLAAGGQAGGSTFLRELGQKQQTFTFFYDAEVEVKKPERKADKENAVGAGARPEPGAGPKAKSRAVGLSLRQPGPAPAKPARREKAARPQRPASAADDAAAAGIEDSPKKASFSAENTPADYLASDADRNGSSTCGISSQMKGIELSSAGAPLKKPVQVPFGELDVAGKRKPAARRPSASSSTSNEKDSSGAEDDKENDAVAAAPLLAKDEEVSPPCNAVDSPATGSVDGLPTNCFAITRPSIEKARVSLHKIQEDEMCRVREYADDIFEYLRQEERLFRPRPSYMSYQPDLAPHMRCMLVDWLVEVAAEYKLSDACLFMAVSYIDRFLSYNKIYRSKLQLLGTTAMFIAAKVEEIYPPESEEFVFITDNTYTKEQLLKMETFILMALDFRMTCVTPYTFYSKYVLDCDVPENVCHLALYLLELAIMEGGEVLNYLPSVQAASAVALAAHTSMIGHAWKKAFRAATNYSFAELLPCMTTMKVIWSKAAVHDQQAIRQKYLEPKMKMVANLPVCATFPDDDFEE